MKTGFSSQFSKHSKAERKIFFTILLFSPITINHIAYIILQWQDKILWGRHFPRKNDKTVKVRVQGRVYDKRVDKEILTRKDYLVHDEGSICKEGDIVRIESIPKISKRKAFAIAEIKVNKGQQFAAYEEMAKTS